MMKALDYDQRCEIGEYTSHIRDFYLYRVVHTFTDIEELRLAQKVFTAMVRSV